MNMIIGGGGGLQCLLESCPPPPSLQTKSCKSRPKIHLHELMVCGGSLQLLDRNGGMERWNGIVECVLQGERSLLMQFPMKLTVAVLFLIEFVIGNKGPEGSLIIQDLGGMPLKDKIARGYLPV